jgi:hypothetical protein
VDQVPMENMGPGTGLVALGKLVLARCLMSSTSMSRYLE